MSSSTVKWEPRCTIAEADKIICAPGTLYELDTLLIDGRLQRVYKNLWPSLRAFWLAAFDLYKDRTYVVLGKQKYTYSEMADRSGKAAYHFAKVYGVKKGDRVGICSRNIPEYLMAFWACHLLGAVTVLVNAWLPTDQMVHCLANTQCKLVILDFERADRLEESVKILVKKSGATGVLVFPGHPTKSHWKGMRPWIMVNDERRDDVERFLRTDPQIGPEDNASIFFTSGTTGPPKGVLSTQRQFLTNVLNVMVPRHRAYLRRGEKIPVVDARSPQSSMLLSIPFFHVRGLTSLTMTVTLGGGKLALMHKWDVKDAVKVIRQERLTAAGGVPTMAVELVESDLVGYPLEAISFGGAPTPHLFPARARSVFPNVNLIHGYGMTESNSLAASIAGEDCPAHPTSCGLGLPVTEIRIVEDGKVLASGQVGEIWIRGPNVMQGYWLDPEATDKVVTKDGWLMSGDSGYMDEEGFLYLRDRIKDIIIRGGENINSITVENALFTDGVLEAVAVGIPDNRLGELVAAVVSVKASERHRITESVLIELARSRLPSFAVPVMVLVQDELPHNQAGKPLKKIIREAAAQEWQKRGGKTVSKL